ncbi:hypothetical protein B9P99_00090 [Candidatus Marsarchaeota G1 archaeon OSP_B]|uniref:Bifunctional NAD(P)H-hydrate repair enzyme n=1 Tax=Candidatus Marsarchaeota G1 archaeon OSP_B TaxID=1978153 RepID=A0A2R6BE61_9ARCH|nr:MAG: hypothetical protein B9P99_00090 [Candidatus Marsarchaeota G1 archaeon OSP_B]
MDELSSIEMRRLELNSEALGVTSFLLMENAGKSVAQEIAKRFQGKVVILTGSGGKAGDGYVAARHLSCLGYQVEIKWVVDPEENKNEAARLHWKVTNNLNSIAISKYQGEDLRADIVVDALLGTGFKGKLLQPYKEAVEKINLANAKKVSIDLPTGLDPDSSDPTEFYVKPHLVVTMHARKPCLKVVERESEVIVAKIGIPLEAQLFVGPGDLLTKIPKRDALSKKGDSGKVLVVAGSSQYTGAAILTCLGCFRSGVDLVYLVSTRETVEAARVVLPELICSEYSSSFLDETGVGKALKLLEKAKSLAIGPGLDFDEKIVERVRLIVDGAFKKRIPVVADADAIKCVGELLKQGWKPAGSLIVTPHAGEFAHISSTPPLELGKRVESVIQAAKNVRCTILLKGYVDVISDGLDLRLSASGVPAMAVAGTGDLLTGVVAGFLSKGLKPIDAASIGAYTLGLAGSLAQKLKGEHLVARDIARYIPFVLKQPIRVALDCGVRRLPSQVVGELNWHSFINQK